MPIRFFCPYGHRLVVPEHRAGKKGRCPKCSQRVIVPVVNPRPSGKPKRPAAEANRPQATAESFEGPLPNWLSDIAEGSTAEPATIPIVPSDIVLQVESPVLSAPQPPPLPLEPVDEPAPAEMTAAPAASIVPNSDAWVAAELIAQPKSEAKPAIVSPPLAASMAPKPVFPAVAPALPAASPQAPPLALPAAGKPISPPAAAPPVAPTLGGVRSRFSSPRLANPRPSRALIVRSWFQPVLPGIDWKRQLPDAGHVYLAYWLAIASVLLAFGGAIPALRFDSAGESPPWAKLIWIFAAVQIFHAVWMASIPDWSTVWGGVWVAAVSAMVYAGGLAVVLSAGPGRAPPLGLDQGGNVPRAWCAANLLLWGLVAFGHGALASRWKNRQAFKARMAAAH